MNKRKIRRQIRKINKNYTTLSHTQFQVLRVEINSLGVINRWYGWLKKGESLLPATWFADGTYYNPQNKHFRGYDLMCTISIK